MSLFAAKSLNFTLLCLALLLCACGGKTSGATGSSDVPLAGGPLAMPTPAELVSRGVSYTEPGLLRQGWAFNALLPNSHVMPTGSRGNFTPDYAGANQSAGHLAECVYVFQADGYNRDASVRLDWQTAPAEGALFVGVANFTLNHWQWFAPTSDTLTLPSAAANFLAPDGSVYVVVAVTGTDPAILNSLRLGARPIAPVLNPAHFTGNAPLNVGFDFTGSADPDGTMTLFELDYQGDGTYDYSSPNIPGTVPFVYNAVGAYYPVLRVTDSNGNAATVSTDVVVTQAGGTPPVASMTAMPASGDVPLPVDFDASASTDDGTIMDYAFDFDGDGIYEEHGALATIQHTYTNAGTFAPKVRAVDNEGHSNVYTFPGGITVTDPINTSPSVQLVATETSSAYPVTYSLDATSALDYDGVIVNYQWDFDHDGDIDLNSGTVPIVSHSYFHQGLFEPTVTVTDNDGAIATSGQLVNIAAGWTVQNAGTQNNPQTLSMALTTFGVNSKLVGIAYSTGGTTVKYITADPASLSNWSSATAVSAENCAGFSTVLTVGDKPAVFYQRVGGNNVGGLSYTRATDNAGTAWSAPILVDNDGSTVASVIGAAMIGGQPAATYGTSNLGTVRYIRAMDATGANWPASFVGVVDKGFGMLATTLFTVNGNPACAAITSMTGVANVEFSRAMDATGAAWPGDSTTLTTAASDTAVGSMGAQFVNLIPAVAYLDSTGGVYFSRSEDTNGAQWPTRIPLFNNTLPNTGITLFDNGGKPGVCMMNEREQLVFIPALDVNGGTWGPPEFIDATGGEGTSCAGLYVDGQTVIAYSDVTHNKIKVAVRTHP